MRRYSVHPRERGGGRDAVNSGSCDSRNVAGGGTVNLRHTQINRTAASDATDDSLGREEQQAQELRRAQSIVLHRKVARKQKRQARQQRQQAQQHRHRLLRSRMKAEFFCVHRQQEHFKQLLGCQREPTQGMELRSGRPLERRQQQTPERHQRAVKEEEVRQLQERRGVKRIMRKGVDRAASAKTRRGKAELQRQMPCDDAVNGASATSGRDRIGSEGEAGVRCGKHLFSRMRGFRAKAAEICGRTGGARSDTSASSSAEEEADEGHRGGGTGRRTELLNYPSTTDDYILPKKAKTSMLHDALKYQRRLTAFSRAEELRRHRLEDQREICYLERQLGFSAPGVCEEKRRKLVARELAVLGLDGDFMFCVDTILQSPQKGLQQHQQERQWRPEKKGDHRDAGQQQEGQKREQRSTKKGETTEEDLPREFGAKNRKKKNTVTRNHAAVENSAYLRPCAESYALASHGQDAQEATAVGHTENVGVKVKAAAMPVLRTDTTATVVEAGARLPGQQEPQELRKTAGGKKMKIFRELPASAHAARVKNKQISHPATKGERTKQQHSRLGERTASFITETSLHSGGKDAKEEKGVEETAEIPDLPPEEGRSKAALQAQEHRNRVNAISQVSSSSECSSHEHRSNEGECYMPPYMRRRLQQEKLSLQREDHGSVFAEAADTTSELVQRLRGLLNRVSEGNVEMVLQQMVAAIKGGCSQRRCDDVVPGFLQLASSTEEDEGFAKQRQLQLPLMHEHFMQRLFAALSNLFIQNAVKNKFSVTALIATQTALCCSLSAILGTQLLCCFLDALGRCFRRYYSTALLLNTCTSTSKEVATRNHTGPPTDGSMCDNLNSDSGVVEKDGRSRTEKQVAGYQGKKALDEEQSAISTAAMYARHVVTAMCFLFDYGALPATVYLQLLERLTLARCTEECAQNGGVELSSRRRNTRIGDSTVDAFTSSSDAPESDVGSSYGMGAARKIAERQTVLSEFQVECLVLALRLGGRKLRCENPQLFKDAWIHLMGKADPGFQTQQSSATGGRSASVTREGREKIAAGGILARGDGASRPEGGDLEGRESIVLEQLKLRFQQRAAAGRTAQSLQEGGVEGAYVSTTTNGRLRFLVHELQELKNNKGSSFQLSSSAAAQESMRRWLQTSPALRSASSLGASSNCCAALLEELEGLTWETIESGLVTLNWVNRFRPTSPCATNTCAGQKRKLPTAASAATVSQSRTKTADAALRELESSNISGIIPISASSNGRHDNVLKLAAKLRFHTENQKKIFSTLMAAGSPNDAVQRLLQLSRKAVSSKQQVVDVVAVVLHSCLQEKTYNPFYAMLLARLCGHCCCGSRLTPPQSAGQESASTSQHLEKAHPYGKSSRGDCLSFSASALPSPAGTSQQAAAAKLRAGCICHTLSEKEAVKYKRVLQRGIAAQTSAAHGFSLRRLLHLAKLEAFLIRLQILELRLVRFLNFDEAAKEPHAGHMGLAGKFGEFLKELCVELLCDQSQASVPIPHESSSDGATAASRSAVSSSPLPLFFSVCNLPDVREALVSVLQAQVSAESVVTRKKYGGNRGRRLSTAIVEKAIWLLKEAEQEMGKHAAGGMEN